jgi:activator of 2-hydroxyglutaryl-CoA dehydratase
MRFSSEPIEGRREFFRSTGRYMLLAVLGVATALMGKRALNSERCINLGICSGCAVFASCGLPQALSAKQAKAKGGS